jgi:hypothetical protein
MRRHGGARAGCLHLSRARHRMRPFKLNRHQQREAIARREAGEALTDIARTFGVHHTTIGRLRAADALAF